MSVAPVCIPFTGRLKYSGLWTGNSRWKSGTIILTGSGGSLMLKIFLSCNPKEAVRTYKLTRESVDRVVCKAHMILYMKNHDAVYFKPADSREEKKVQNAVQIIQEMHRSKTGPLVQGTDVWEDSSTPLKTARLSSSPEKFTSMKETPKISRRINDDENQEESKENTFRGPGRNQEDQCFPRSQSLKSIGTGDFYNSQKSYGFYTSGVKRPGLMPFNPQDQAKKPRLLDKVSFSWQNCSVNNQIKPSTALQGFSNLGNTCYMNATLQSLLGLDPFISDMLQANRKIHRLLLTGSLYTALVRLMSARNKLTGTERRRDILLSVKNAVSSTACRFSGNQQHDAHEFLGQVLDQLSEEFNKIMTSASSPRNMIMTSVSSPQNKIITSTSTPHKDGKKSDSLPNPVDNNFSFEVVHKITCFNCQEEVSKAESFHDLSLYLPQSSHICIQSAVDDFLKNEELDYTCAKCGHSRSQVTHKFSRLPRILILHIKRYSFNDEISCWNKTRQKISISRFISLAPHCVDSTQPPPAMLHSQLEHLSPVKNMSGDRFGDSRSRHQSVSWKFKPLSSSITEDSTKCDDSGRAVKQESCVDNFQEDCSEDNSEFDKELQKALELSRLESEKNISVGYLKEKDLQKLTEDEQLQLALQNSLVDDSMIHSEISFTGSSGIGQSQTGLAGHEDHRDPPTDHWYHTHQAEDISKSNQQNKPQTICSDQFVNSDLESLKSVEGVLLPKTNSGLNHCLSAFDCSQSRCERKSGLKDCQNDLDAFDTGQTMSDRKSDLKYCQNVSNTVDKQKSDKNCDKTTSESCTGGMDGADNCGIPSHPAGTKSQMMDAKHNAINSNGDRETVTVDAADDCDVTKERSSNTQTRIETCGSDTTDVKLDVINITDGREIVMVDSADDHDGVTKEHSGGTQSRVESGGGDAMDNGSNLLSLCGGSSTELISTCEHTLPGSCVNSDENKNINNTTGGEEETSDADKEGIDLRCFEEKENVLPTQADPCDPGDWDDDLFNTSLCEVTDPQTVDNNQDGSLPVSYRLVSIVNHIGSSSSAGHYISDVYDMNKQNWFSYDDTHVTRVTESDIQIKRQRTGYIFFYMLKDLFEENISYNTTRSLLSKKGS